MPLEFKSPSALVGETPADGTGQNRSPAPHSLADQPHEAYRSPLVDALLEQMRQARARRLRPH
jgi:hypothetical protein